MNNKLDLGQQLQSSVPRNSLFLISSQRNFSAVTRRLKIGEESHSKIYRQLSSNLVTMGEVGHRFTTGTAELDLLDWKT